MLSEQEVHAIFTDELDGLEVVNVPRIPYIQKALRSPFIRKQIQLGIYDEENIYTDFLSPACSFVSAGRVEYSYELICLLNEGVPDDIARRYLRHVAHHEAHHFTQEARPLSWQDHARAELDCIEHMDASAETEFAEHSATYIRVLKRIALIEKGLIKRTNEGDLS